MTISQSVTEPIEPQIAGSMNQHATLEEPIRRPGSHRRSAVRPEVVHQSKGSAARYVQFGAGLCGPDGWTNFDISPTLRLQRLPLIGKLFGSIGPKFPAVVRYGDIIRGLPCVEASCDAIYCSHVLEHLSLDDFRTALRNTYKYLKPGGRFRFVLPDLEKLARDYISSTESDAALAFMRDSYLGHQSRPKNFLERLRGLFGNSAHLWMWDYKSISHELSDIGFARIRRAQFGDSGDARFDVVEDVDRWTGCLGVDCIKPEF